MLIVIAEFLGLYEDYKFRNRKKARRKFEKENNLPKKIMIHPVWMLFIILMFLFFIGKLLFFSNLGEKRTIEKMTKIEEILDKEKLDIGIYPEQLKSAIRNNPLRKNITVDFWKNEFFYEQLENGQDYILISKGKDGILKTDDDINKNVPNK